MENQFDRKKLFIASCMALVVTSMTFAIRARLESVFLNDYQLTATDLGLAFAPAFFGFTIAMIVGGPLVDIFGMKRIVSFAFIGHLAGIVITLFAYDLTTLFIGTLAIGIGNGMVEASLNPLVASLYPTEKTKMLNRFHVWFPGGIVIGSIVAYLLMDVLGLSWQVMVSSLFVPLLIYGYLFLPQSFPKTERVEMGVTSAEMWKSILKPLFLFIAFCMILTASTELATNQRIDSLLKETGVSGILVLAFINGIMMIGRGFAGPVVKKLDTTGMLLFSAIFSFLGLYWLSWADGYMVFAAAGVFAVGICFFWPTMLGFVAENLPETGALGLSLMGGIGMFSVSIVLPIMGTFMDAAQQGGTTLRYMAILPFLLIFLFTGLFLYMKKKKKHAVA